MLTILWQHPLMKDFPIGSQVEILKGDYNGFIATVRSYLNDKLFLAIPDLQKHKKEKFVYIDKKDVKKLKIHAV